MDEWELREERESDLLPLSQVTTLLRQTSDGKQPNAVWPPEHPRPWIVIRRRTTPQYAKGIKRKSYLEPKFVSEKWREFYRWVRTYTQGPGEARIRTLPGECTICGDSGYVLTKSHKLVTCPRWDAFER